MARANVYICLTLAAVFSVGTFAADDTKKANKKDDKIGKPSKTDRAGMRAAGEERWERGFELILDHEKELNLTADQKTKLTDLKKSIEEKFSKLKDDPDMRELFTQMYEARQAEDKDHMQELQKKIRQALEKKGVNPEGLMLEVGKILNREQLKTLGELRKKNGMEENPMKKLRDQKAEEKKDEQRERPDANKGAPSLYDNESK